MHSKRICIVGSGYVGLVTGAGLAKLGHTVVCVDINEAKIDNLRRGKISFYEQDLPQLVQEGISEERLLFTTDLAEGLRHTRYVIMAVDTPRGEEGGPDLTQVFQVVDQLGGLISEPIILIVKSTVPIGVFDKISARLAAHELQEGRDYELVSCPEFLAEGSAVKDFFHPTRTVVGARERGIAREVANLFYLVTGPRVFTDPKTAQLIKYASNSLLASRVAFINEIARVCEEVGVDVHDVARGVLLDARFGHGYLRAGIGFGGPCLPKDLAALAHTARQSGHTPVVCEAIALQNADQIRHTVERIASLLPQGGKAAVLGLAFKPGTSDVRNALSVPIVEGLVEKGFAVTATDPWAVGEVSSTLEASGVRCVDSVAEAVRGSDVQVFLTPWPEYVKLDFHELRGLVAAPSVFDGPGMFDPETVIQAGFQYSGIGRLNVRPNLAIEE